MLSPEKNMLHCAKSRAKKSGKPFNITADDICIPEICPVLNIPIKRGVGRGGLRDGSPSLDCLRPELGYVKGNVAVISLRANRIKSDATLEEIKAVAEAVTRVMKERGLPLD